VHLEKMQCGELGKQQPFNHPRLHHMQISPINLLFRCEPTAAATTDDYARRKEESSHIHERVL